MCTARPNPIWCFRKRSVPNERRATLRKRILLMVYRRQPLHLGDHDFSVGRSDGLSALSGGRYLPAELYQGWVFYPAELSRFFCRTPDIQILLQQHVCLHCDDGRHDGAGLPVRLRSDPHDHARQGILLHGLDTSADRTDHHPGPSAHPALRAQRRDHTLPAGHELEYLRRDRHHCRRGPLLFSQCAVYPLYDPVCRGYEVG